MTNDNHRGGDSEQYRTRKQFFDSLLTIYGRKPVLEALQDDQIPVYKLHLADSNQPGGILSDIEKLAKKRGIEIAHHSREQLSRISRNRKQDQGVAADLQCPHYRSYQDFLDQGSRNNPFQLLALDNVTNPQNLGMVIRSVCASPLDGLLLPARGCAALSPLVIKASAGTLFRCPILRCDDLAKTLETFRGLGAEICVLSGCAPMDLADYRPEGSVVYVLGNESEGVSEAVSRVASRQLRIPMARGVESLNVAVAAALIAFRGL